MSQEQPLISVIVPVYKAEAYLDACVESIVKQTYRNLEIILVDDGSPDRSPEMCDTWAAKDSRIKVVHKKNGGASDARNAGLDVFLGDYVTFIDADDLVAYDMVDVLLKACFENHTNVSMCALQNFSEGAPSLVPLSGKIEVLSGHFICEHFFDYYASGPVAKLYSKSVLENAKFILNRRAGEDAAFTYPIFYKQEKVAFIYRPMYFYRQYAASATGSYNVHLMDELLTLEEMLKFYKAHSEMSLFQAMAMEYFARILAHQNKIKRYLQGPKKELMAKLNARIQQLFTSDLGIRMRVLFYFARLFPKVFLKIYFGWHDYQQSLLKR